MPDEVVIKHFNFSLSLSGNGESIYIHMLCIWPTMGSFNKQREFGELIKKIGQYLGDFKMCDISNFYQISCSYSFSHDVLCFKVFPHLIWAHLAATSHLYIRSFSQTGVKTCGGLVACILFPEQEAFYFVWTLFWWHFNIENDFGKAVGFCCFCQCQVQVAIHKD